MTMFPRDVFPQELLGELQRVSDVVVEDGKPQITGGVKVRARQLRHPRGWDALRDAAPTTGCDTVYWGENPCEELIRKCIAEGGKFVDGTYLKQDKWMRLGDVYWSPTLFLEGASPDDVQQGSLGDCWLLSAVSAISTRVDMAEVFYPGVYNPYGVYSVRFCIDGRPCYVVIDDYVPVDKHQRPAFSHCENGEIWVPLLEKAYAKLHGGYSALEGGGDDDDNDIEKTPDTIRFFSDLSGGFARYIRLDDDDDAELFFEEMKDVFEHSGCATTSCGEGGDNEQRTVGLIAGHDYTVMDIHDGGEGKRFLRLRNPWGRVEWKGPYSDVDEERWGRDPALHKALLDEKGYTKRDDGSFWIHIDDYFGYFDSAHICYNILEGYGYLGHRGTTADGPLHPDFTNNPRYLLTLPAASHCFFSLTPPDPRFSPTPSPLMMFSIFTLPPSGPHATLRRASALFNSPLQPDVGKWLPLDAGRYIIMVSGEAKGFVGEFLFRFAASCEYTLREVGGGGGAVAVLRNALDVTGRSTAAIGAGLKTAFEALDTDGSGTISRREFTAAFDTLEDFGVAHTSLFNKLDASNDGKLTYDEFACVMLSKLRQ